MVHDRAATTCNSCGRKVRDISKVKIHLHHLLIFFLKHYECRIFKKQEESNLSISKSKEIVYYHPLNSCLKKKYGEGNANYTVPHHVEKNWA